MTFDRKALDHISGEVDNVRTARILYVEEDPICQELVERGLDHRAGITLLTATQGGLGLKLALEHEPDLILLDLHLPDIHGSEVLRRIREDPVTSLTPVVIIGTDVTSAQLDQLLVDGAQAYLPKPLDIQQLLGVVDRVLAEHR